MKTVLLVNPKTVNKYYHVSSGWVDRLFVRLIRRQYHDRFDLPSHRRCTAVPPITLFGLRALLQDRCRVDLVDEQTDRIDFGAAADLVCITATTPQIGRAREIAAAFGRRGIPTAIGGIHATCLPEECAESFDVVCVGEAEAYIDEMMRDLERGDLARRYVADGPVDMERAPFYDYELSTGSYVPFYAINFSRGCTSACEFCSVRATVGRHRTRSVDSVVRRIAESGAREVWFSDAALTANREAARALFRALVPLRIKWLSSIQLDVARDESLLDLMAESGCWLASAGFESLSQSNLERSGKGIRVREFERAIKRFHERDIAIEGNFVFGFDGDDEDVFDRTARFTVHAGIDIPEFYMLTPYPGTRLYERLLAEGRIVHRDWRQYDNAHFHHLPVFRPAGMSRRALRDGCRRADRIAYDPLNVIRRLRNARVARPSVYIANFVYARRIVQRRNLMPRGEEYLLSAEDPAFA